MRHCIARSIPTMIAIGVTAIANSCAGAPYIIDPTLSSVTVAIFDHGTGIPLTIPQSPGSDTTNVFGTVDVTVAGGNITFNSTNNIVYGNQATPQLPGPGGGVVTNGTITVSPDPAFVGSGIANWGLQFIVPTNTNILLDPTFPNAAVAGWGDISNGIVDLTGIAPIAGGVFPASTLLSSIFQGNLEYNFNAINANYPTPPAFGLPFTSGSTSLAGGSGLNSLAGNGSLVGNTLTIPVGTIGQIAGNGLLVDLVLTGKIVARAAPEPGAIVLAIVGMIGFIPFVRRYRTCRDQGTSLAKS
jgi:hypothetical protein